MYMSVFVKCVSEKIVCQQFYKYFILSLFEF